MAWYQPEYGLFLSVPPTKPQPQQEKSGSGGFTSRLEDERPAGVPDPGSPLFQYWIPKSNSPSGLSAHCDHTRPLRVLVTSPFMGFPPTMLSTGPAPAGASAATANSPVSMPNMVNIATTAIRMAFGIPSPSFVKITTKNNRKTLFD